MAKEILKDEIMSDEELDGVAGGTRIETYQDGDELYKRGLLTEKQVFREQTLRAASVRELLHKMGYTGYKDNDGSVDANIYTDKSGNVITREQFLKNFDADYSRTILEKFRV